MLKYHLDFINIPADESWNVQAHKVQIVNIFDSDISAVLPYYGHDVVIGDKSYEHPPTYCLKTYLMHISKRLGPYIASYDYNQLKILSKLTEGRISTISFLKARDLIRNLLKEGRIKRIAEKCVQCMKLEKIIKETQQSS